MRANEPIFVKVFDIVRTKKLICGQFYDSLKMRRTRKILITVSILAFFSFLSLMETAKSTRLAKIIMKSNKLPLSKKYEEHP